MKRKEVVGNDTQRPTELTPNVPATKTTRHPSQKPARGRGSWARVGGVVIGVVVICLLVYYLRDLVVSSCHVLLSLQPLTVPFHCFSEWNKKIKQTADLHEGRAQTVQWRGLFKDLSCSTGPSV